MSRAFGGDATSDGADQMQQKIQVARRDAESLKDKIKRKKDELADTTRKSGRAEKLYTSSERGAYNDCARTIELTSMQSVMSLETEQNLYRDQT